MLGEVRNSEACVDFIKCEHDIEICLPRMTNQHYLQEIQRKNG